MASFIRTALAVFVTISMVTASMVTVGIGAETRPALGSKVDVLEFKDVWYLQRTLNDLPDKKAYAIVFTTLASPQVKAYLPELKKLDEAYRDRGVQFLCVNVGPKDSIRDMAAQALELEIKFPFVKDFTGQCVKALGARKVGEVVVLDADRRIQYRGRIDDSSGRNAAAKHRDLAAAVDSVLAGRKVTPGETAVTGEAIADLTPAKATREITFAKDVAPLLAKNCQHCHRAGTEAPFSLISYEDVAGHADSIAEVVVEERMPPWYASFGDFANAPTLVDEEKETIRQWVAAGCPKGDLASLPEPPKEYLEPQKWTIEEPDLVIQVPQAHELPADGYIPYKYVILPYRFPHDTWIQQCEILPDNPRVVHHCNMAYLENAFDWNNAKFMLGKVPGVQPMLLGNNIAFRVPKGSTLVLQIHYTTTGQPEKCRISVGMRYAREVVQKEFHYLWMVDTKFAIPPGDPLHRVSATNLLDCDALGMGLFAHMHVRGRDMTFIAHYPDGKSEKLLTIPNYSFDWQLAYRWEMGTRKFPKGTKIECVSHYDNSKFNPFNPDPTATVREGQQTFEEMLNGVMFYLDESEALNLHIDPKTGKVMDDTATRSGG